MNTKSVFETLSVVDVSKHTKELQGNTYLPWAYAWKEVKSRYPNAVYALLDSFTDESLGTMCRTSVTIEGETLEMWLPVMNGANKAMKNTPYTYETRYGSKEVAAATMFDINKTIMRCLVKNLAMFGLGINIYAGEDMPLTEEESAPKEKAAKGLQLVVDSANWKRVAVYIAANKDKGLPAIVKALEKKYNNITEVKPEIEKLLA